MTPREALKLVKSIVVAVHEQIGIVQDGKVSDVPIEALAVLERLVAKDEAEAKQVEPDWKAVAKKLQCTCGTVTPCAVWGHS